jgi:RimJ/RimL family protein N-acetyltransferase
MFIEITNSNVRLLEIFISSMGDSNKSFRYFNKRTTSAIKNHLVTVVLLMDKIPVVYGHLDRDEDKVWLGIAVSQQYRGKGGGNLMMEYLVIHAKDLNLTDIYLSVDKDNFPAIKLYNKFGFVQIDDKNDILYFVRKLN